MVTKTSYLEVYAEEVIPRLRAIDMRLKSGESISPGEAADLLGIDGSEAASLRQGRRGDMGAAEFLTLMSLGSSGVCRMYRRETELGSPPAYTAEDIAYIYGLDMEQVRGAFRKIKASAVTEYMLAEVFREIWV